jgi:hypothetical protein
VAQLSEWLQIMLGEIARKQEEAQIAGEEAERRLACAPPVSSLTPSSASAPAPPAERSHAL